MSHSAHLISIISFFYLKECISHREANQTLNIEKRIGVVMNIYKVMGVNT